MFSGIERRREPRVRIAVRVQISGRDAQYEEYSEKVLAMNLSRHGALLWGVQAELEPGDILSLSYGQRSAQCRIVWVLDEARGTGSHVAVRLLQNQDCPWEEALPAHEAAEQLC
jgi:hypothetical protein